MQGRADANQYIKSFKISHSINNNEWIELSKLFNINKDAIKDQKSEVRLENSINAKYIRIYPQTYKVICHESRIKNS